MPTTLLGPCEYREEIRKSRFLALAAPVSSAAEAHAFIDSHSDLAASHNCWAWKVGIQYRLMMTANPAAPLGGPSSPPSKGRTATRWWCW